MNNRLLTIGLEIHCKLKSETKMFCQCRNQQNFDILIPNTNVCPVCTGQPGALPTLSKEALWKAILVGKALNCTINPISKFDRKSYFYPDLPMGYQITQLYQPTNTKGTVSFFLNNYTQEKSINVIDAHLECDTAKMIHDWWQALLDFNRAGTPLIEIVTGPDFRSDDEVVEFLKELQRIVRYNDISDADLEKGQMRVDVNISIRKTENDQLGTRVELKNMNSFSAIKRAIEHEYTRQKDLYESGQTFTQQTRGWDDENNSSYPMRSKEDALDYRYFPEPDLPPLVLEKEILAQLENTQLEIPYLFIKKAKEEYGFNKEYINALIGEKELLDYFLSIDIEAKLKAKWICGPIVAWLKENFVTTKDLKFTKAQFLVFLQKAKEGTILENQLKIIMDEMIATGQEPENIIKEKGFNAPSLDNNELESIIQTVLTENPTIVEQYTWGKTTTLWFFIGQVMKKTGGKVDPQKVGELVQKQLWL